MQNTIFIAPDAGPQWCWSGGEEARTGSLDELSAWRIPGAGQVTGAEFLFRPDIVEISCGVIIIPPG